MPTTTIDLSQTRQCACLRARKRARALTRLYDRHLRPHGLRSTQFSVLAVLSQKGESRLGEVAELLGLERTTLTRSVTLLERNGWIVAPPAEDAREHRLTLTASGLRTLEAAFPSWRKAQDLVESGWDG